MTDQRDEPPRRSADFFDLWLKTSLRQRWGAAPGEEAVPKDLLRLVCDTRSEWIEMKDRWAERQRRGTGSLD